MSCAFPKERRLLKRREFVAAQRASLAIRVKHAVLLLHRRDQTGPMRLGVVASRKVGVAVVRNRGKRLVREWFRHLRLELPGCDVVVVLRRGAPGEDGEPFRAALTEGLKRAAQRLRRRGRPAAAAG